MLLEKTINRLIRPAWDAVGYLVLYKLYKRTGGTILLYFPHNKGVRFFFAIFHLHTSMYPHRSNFAPAPHYSVHFDSEYFNILRFRAWRLKPTLRPEPYEPYPHGSDQCLDACAW